MSSSAGSSAPRWPRPRATSPKQRECCRPTGPISTAGCDAWGSTGSSPTSSPTPETRMRVLVGGLFLLLGASALRAQDSVIVIDPDAPPSDSVVVHGGPPPGLVAELITFFNDSATTRMSGEVSFPTGTTFEGKLAQYRGSLRIAGRVNGPIAVANGTLYLLPGAEVNGEILVVGGRLIRSDGARHDGRERVFWDAAPVLRLPGGTLALRERRRPLGELAA